MDADKNVWPLTSWYRDDYLGTNILNPTQVFDDKFHVVLGTKFICECVQNRRASIVGPDFQGGLRGGSSSFGCRRLRGCYLCRSRFRCCGRRGRGRTTARGQQKSEY